MKKTASLLFTSVFVCTACASGEVEKGILIHDSFRSKEGNSAVSQIVLVDEDGNEKVMLETTGIAASSSYNQYFNGKVYYRDGEGELAVVDLATKQESHTLLPHTTKRVAMYSKSALDSFAVMNTGIIVYAVGTCNNDMITYNCDIYSYDPVTKESASLGKADAATMFNRTEIMPMQAGQPYVHIQSHGGDGYVSRGLYYVVEGSPLKLSKVSSMKCEEMECEREQLGAGTKLNPREKFECAGVTVEPLKQVADYLSVTTSSGSIRINQYSYVGCLE